MCTDLILFLFRYQKLDMNSCLAQLKNPTAVQLSKPQAFEKVTISLKSFPLPASGVIKAMTSTLSATEAAVTSKSLIATRLLPGTDNANAAEMTIPNNEGAYSSPKQSSLALFSRQQHADTIESQVMCVNKLYISIAGKFYGYPAHRQHDLALVSVL